MLGAGPPQGDGQAGRVEDGGGVVADEPLELGGERGAAQLVEHLSSLRPNSSGRTRLTITAASSTEVSLATRPASSMVSLTGISSGVVTMTRPVVAGSERMSRIQSVWERMSPTFTRSLMAWGAASCPTM